MEGEGREQGRRGRGGGGSKLAGGRKEGESIGS